jgi:hypothetical protein
MQIKSITAKQIYLVIKTRFAHIAILVNESLFKFVNDVTPNLNKMKEMVRTSKDEQYQILSKSVQTWSCMSMAHICIYVCIRNIFLSLRKIH